MDENERFGLADLEAHSQFALFLFHGLPASAQSEEVNRLTLAYFLVSSLDLLRALPLIDATQVIEWVYAHQVLPSTSLDGSADRFCGFRGSLSGGVRFDPSGASALLHDGGQLASTYSALAILSILGDKLGRVHKPSLLMSMKKLQQHDGSFTSTHMGSETDLRFVYCAVAISVMLKDWAGIDTKKASNYILNCQSYDSGFGLFPGQESHGGATYCAIASLSMLGHINVDPLSRKASSALLDVNGVIKWCIQKQTQSGGFQGRTNKDPDACYAFWVAGSLHLLGAGHLCNADALQDFLARCADKANEKNYSDFNMTMFSAWGFQQMARGDTGYFTCILWHLWFKLAWETTFETFVLQTWHINRCCRQTLHNWAKMKFEIMFHFPP